MYVWSESRFLCKLSIGLLFSLFGSKIFEDRYFNDLFSGLWQDNQEQPSCQIIRNFHLKKEFKQRTGIKGAVTISLTVIEDRIVITLNIGGEYACEILTISIETLSVSE